jgi:hypothetical protein
MASEPASMMVPLPPASLNASELLSLLELLLESSSSLLLLLLLLLSSGAMIGFVSLNCKEDKGDANAESPLVTFGKIVGVDRRMEKGDDDAAPVILGVEVDLAAKDEDDDEDDDCRAVG